MPEQRVSFAVDDGLWNAFTHTAAKNSCNDTDLLKAFVAEYVRQDTRKEEYEAWFRAKVERGLAELRKGEGYNPEEATAHMTAFKASLHTEEEQ